MTVKIVIHNITSQIFGGLTAKVINQLAQKLSYELPGAYFMQQVNPYAGVRYLFSKRTYQFPTGLIRMVEEVLTQNNISYQIIDSREKPSKQEPELPLHGHPLRNYQQYAVEQAVQKQRGIIKVGTGGGKTAILAAIIAKLNVPTLILIHKKDVFYQLIETFEQMLRQPIGRVGDGQCQIERFTVGMIQTISRLYEPQKRKKKADLEVNDEKLILNKGDQIRHLVETSECIITDETHHVASDTFWNVHRRAKKAYYKFGTSASPWREDNAGLLIEAAHARQFIDIPASSLIEQGFLAPPKVYLYSFRHDKKSRDDYSYPEIYDEEIMRNDIRNQAITEVALKAAKEGKTVLISITKVEHGKLLEAILQQIEPEALFVSGESDSDLRKQVLKELNERKRKIVICTTIFGEGIDCLTGDTKIKLLDGTIRTIQNLHENNVQNFWIYSSTSDGHIQPARALKTRLARKQAPVIEVILDNKKYFKCTPDHLVMLRDGTYKQAKDLQVNDSLMPLYTDHYNGYEMCYVPGSRTKKFTHRIVGEFVHGPQIYGVEGNVFHHLNFNRKDNRPVNLKLMTFKDHNRYHSSVLANLNRERWKDPKYRAKMLPIKKRVNRQKAKRKAHSITMKKIIKKLKEAGKVYREWTPAQREVVRKEVKLRHKLGVYQEHKKVEKLISQFTKEFFIKELLLYRAQGLQKRYNCSAPTLKQVGRHFGIHNFRQVFDDAVRQGQIVHPLRNKTKSLAHCRNISKSKKKTLKGKITPQLLSMWRGSRKKYLLKKQLNNHKVVSTRKVGAQDVYDIISVTPNSNYALECGVFVHNCPNLDVLINAKAGASSVDAFQLIGRVLRKTATKSKAYLVDIFDRGCKYVSSHSNKRLKIYKTEPKYQLEEVSKLDEIDFKDELW